MNQGVCGDAADLSFAFDQVLLPQPGYEQLLEHAWTTWPQECCGLLAGRVHRRQGYVSRVVPVTNALASPVAYQTEPRELLRAFRGLRQEQLELLGFYHSHPAGPSHPSRRDLSHNTYGPGVVHLIISLADKGRPQLQAWRLFPHTYVAVPCRVLNVTIKRIPA
ncbi:MAG: M67 family metallopeptidase [Gemmataceae bacterium]|nr:M67 family metallopeptidase [Gemmataceae bacterium]MCS7269797.1 M67 family metallopeptidase [Gemmataceae bacterium]MDW8242478.1 M67 family metallopeptidase [Thermogemmata sp.]